MTDEKKKRRSHGEDLVGAARLVVDATARVTTVVEGMHRTIASGPAVLGQPLAVPARVLTALVYGGIRGVTRAVGAGVEAVLAELGPLLGDSVPGAERAAVLAALNGVVGDYLVATANPLAIEMCVCTDGHALEIDRGALAAVMPHATGKLLLLVHGSSMNDLQWSRAGHDHGRALAGDVGLSALYLRYNSGLHVSSNGRAFAALLEGVVGAWPVPVEEIVLLGHSMGGLVARSACHAAEQAGHAWRGRLTRLVCLGTPHHGAPLERAGSSVHGLLGVSRYSAPLAPLAKLRSAGVTDLRYGNVLDAHWSGRDRFATAPDTRERLALPTGVESYAIAATTSPAPGKRLRGDGLVPVESALGRHPRPELDLGFPEDHQWIGYGMGHLDLLSRPEVYARIRSWLS